MAYIAKIEVPHEWTALGTLLPSDFAEDTEYLIQSESLNKMRFCDTDEAPTDPEEGEYLLEQGIALYKKGTGTLYVYNVSPYPSYLIVSELA